MNEELTMEETHLTFPNTPVWGRQVLLLQRFWKAFHNSIIIALLFSMIGIAIGVKVSKDYYADKMDECVQTGAMLVKTKVYILTPRP